MLDFQIRAATKNDWPQIVSIYNYYIVNSAFNFEQQVHSIESLASWFSNFLDGGPYQLLVGANKQGEIVGYATTTPFSAIIGYQSSFNISIYCEPKYKGRGIGSRLLNEIIDRSKLISFAHRLYAGITVSNDLSINLFQKFGFIKVAHFTEVGYKFDRYWDVIWFEKHIAPTTQG
ncbi:GNAT family N-acetyltransferase [Legionella hackeliae]|uniref:Phosphinothricin acetyltransferase n=1 Tax=Legionella hackeliae TaxID=449 RepID=A0A0A8UWL0_LEGHA|nr:GNAT family N-acetyltransferase [Legionella hackeliae]KTD13199.1 N-acyltransferase YncA [Legionella hackeliae]CEK11487.1 Phosphinothricin acetyltransferase [Legionella hackeliae]STX48256.1 N-acyltransferase YncA [Legionella hackeliae]